MTRFALLERPVRRGWPLAVPLALVLSVACWGRRSEWVGVWSETQRFLGIAFVLAIPIAAALGAWVGAASVRTGMVELRRGGSRPPLQVAAREYGEPAVWIVLGYLLGSVPSFVLTATSSEFDRPRLLPLLAQAACVAGVAVLGQTLGSRLPWLLGAPVCLVVTYMALGFLSFEHEDVLIALTPIDDRWATFHQTMGWVLLLQVLGWGLVVVHAVVRRAGHDRPALALAVLIGCVAAPLLYVSPRTQTVPDAGVTLVCTDGRGLAVCVPAAKQLLEPMLRVEAGRVMRLLDGLVPDRLALVDDEAAGISGAADRSVARTVGAQEMAGKAAILLSEAGDISAYAHLDVDQFHRGVIAYLVPETVGGHGGEHRIRPQASPSDVVRRWYLHQVGRDVGDTSGSGSLVLEDELVDFGDRVREVELFSSMDEASRARWFAAHAAAIASGTLTWSDFAGA